MKKVIIASQNPVKIKATQMAFQRMFPTQKFEFQGIAVSSNVSDQPFSNQETFQGAWNRVQQIAREIKTADFYVGIEGGLEVVNNELEIFAWMLIKSGKKYGKSRTSTFFLPPKIAKFVKQGKELGEADDLVFKTRNSKQKNGAIGILTADIITRTKYYTEALILALIPFKNPDLY